MTPAPRSLHPWFARTPPTGAATLDDPATLRAFQANLARCDEQLANYQQDGNRALLDALDARLTPRARASA